MKIRAITSFFDPVDPGPVRVLENLARFSHEAVDLFGKSGFEVQTTRLATTPFPGWLPLESDRAASEAARALEVKAAGLGFSYLGLGPALPQVPVSFERLLPMLKATENTFFGGLMAAKGEGVHLAAVRACARVVAGAANITSNGFTNLRFAALANVGPFSPFFPAGYAIGTRPAFGLAMEAADVAVDAFGGASSLADARRRLLDALEQNCAELESIASDLSARFGIDFKGIDCSLAPFPESWCSIGDALQSLGVPVLGRQGSLAAAAFLADSLDRGKWKKTGFNGLFLPVLEDSTLAGRAFETVTLKDLLLFSAVCGTGLDTVPLPGNVTAGQIEALLLDVAALAVRLNKQLTARLMPVPGKKAGELTSFDFSYFKNGRVMALEADEPEGFLAGDEIMDIKPRF
ncbi:MAG TPA: DUF711 family protein [Anaerolineaceae bacterium]|nr:DUF711 family protein [Anaerolineaceae bacterium]